MTKTIDPYILVLLGAVSGLFTSPAPAEVGDKKAFPQARLGGTLRLGNVEVTPLKLQHGPIKLQSRYDGVRDSDDKTLSFHLKIRNISEAKVFHISAHANVTDEFGNKAEGIGETAELHLPLADRIVGSDFYKELQPSDEATIILAVRRRLDRAKEYTWEVTIEMSDWGEQRFQMLTRMPAQPETIDALREAIMGANTEDGHSAPNANSGKPPSAAVGPGNQNGGVRTWTDSSGKHTVEARFRSMTNGVVTLQKLDGSEITLLLDRLSDADQRWILGTGLKGLKGLEGRATAASRAWCVQKYDGNAASEAAVAAALRWLAKAQTADGGWNFDHRLARDPSVREADHAGRLTKARNGATAMALLPFLAAGQTHTAGAYKSTVKGGLSYLMTRMKRDGSMHEDGGTSGGTICSHGLSAITLCEAYAMTQDKPLMAPAQASLNFIALAQDPVGGGWGYEPRQPGGTTSVSWQLTALKSGQMAYLEVPPNTIRGAARFLDTVQSQGGANYGDRTPGAGTATTAAGLLCRMYLGWSHENEALKNGVEWLSAKGPDKRDMYYNYYATQVMRQYGGEHWDKWNARMRDFLVDKQDKQGAAKGSWYFAGRGALEGGRIYNTSLATMILEVYYRHMPIY